MAADPNPDDLTVAELRERATKLEIAGRSSMNKDDLVAAVTAAQSESAQPKGDEWQEDDEGSTLVKEDASSITAPSIGPNTVIEREAPEDRLARAEQSQVDAMGQDKRRSVRGKSYGPSIGRQALAYGAFFVVVAVLFVGARFAVKELDKPDPNRTDTAPWAQADAGGEPPAPIDFPRAITP